MTVSKEVARLNTEAWEIRSKERDRSAELAQKALALSIKAKDKVGEMTARLTLADYHCFRMQLDHAAEELARCEDLLRADTPRIVSIRWKRLHCYMSFQKNDLSKVIALGAELLGLIRNRGHEGTRSWALLTMGIAYQRLGDPYRALNSYRDAEFLIVKQGEKNAISNIRMSIGTALGELGQREEALKMFEEALFLRLSIGGAFHTGLILGNMAKILHQLGDHAKALPKWDEAVAYFKEAGGMPLWVQAQAGKADTLLAMDRLTEAEQQLLQALEAAQSLTPLLKVSLHLSLSRVLAARERWQDMLDQLRQAEALTTGSTDHTQFVELHSGYHSAFKALHDPASALHHHEQMVMHREKSINALNADRLSQWKAQYQTDRLIEQNDRLTQENASLNATVSRLTIENGQLGTSAAKCMKLAHEMLEILPQQHRERFRQLTRSAERHLTENDTHSAARSQILQAHPTLTPAELRVCGMVALGWSGKEIADKMGITVKGVDKHRLSIRRKIVLPKSITLQVYLEGLGLKT